MQTPNPAHRRPATPVRPGRDGFSVVELLVVVGVIAIQAALVFPAFGRARNAARAAGCLGNLRQWGTATHLYAVDHEDVLPPEGVPNPGLNPPRNGWYVQLPRQLGLRPYSEMPWRTNASAIPAPSPWLCPENTRRSNGRNLFHYCLNQFVDGSGSEDLPVRLANINDPSRLVWLFDSKNLPAVGPGNYAHTNLHSAGAQFLFLDGHAARFRREVYWDAALRRARTNLSELSWMP